MLFLLLIALAWALSCLAADAFATDKGIKAGIAVEANTVVKFFSKTNKPTFWQVFGVEAGVIRFPVFGIGAAAAVLGNAPLAFLMAVVLLVAGVKNIQGARQWQWMFKHPGQKLPVMNTVWQKIVGFWG